MFFGFITMFIPYYGLVRMGFFIFLMAPQTKGAYVLYSSVLKPFLKAHEKEIMSFIDQFKKQADEVAKEGMAIAKESAKDLGTAENIAKGAAMMNQAQAKMDEFDKKQDEGENKVE